MSATDQTSDASIGDTATQAVTVTECTDTEATDETNNVNNGLQDNDNECVSEQQKEANEENQDDDGGDDGGEEDGDAYFSALYGPDDEIDPDSDNENTYEETVDRKPDITAIDASKKPSAKRRSEETDGSQNKRIKSEPKDLLIESSEKRLTTTIEVVTDEEPSAPEIPNNTYDFMSYLLDLNANDLEINDTDFSHFPMSKNLQNISEVSNFQSFEELRKIFIPYILTDLWQKLKTEYNRKHTKHVNVVNLKRFLSILTKVKSINKMKNGLEMRCISIVRQRESPVFRFGQLITIQTAVQAKPNSSKHIFTRRKYFGYITSHTIRSSNADNQSETNLLKLLNEKEPVYIEEINFTLKYSDELYLRNDSLLVAEPISCVHNHYMEARAVFKLDQFPLWKQIFNPVFSRKPSGLQLRINERKFDTNEINIIQIALDVVGNPSLSNSVFFAINGPKDSQRTNILSEAVRQLVGCHDLRQRKVLFCSSDSSTLNSVKKYLNSRKIMTYIVGNGYDDNLKEVSIKYLEHKHEKETDEGIKEQYFKLLEHLDTGCPISVDIAVMKYSSIAERAQMDAMRVCPVIMGRIEDLCNDMLFYKFASKDLFNSCVIDDSTAISEPQLYSLFLFDIKKFLMGGDMTLPVINGTDIFRANGLSRSFFERYYNLHKESDHSNQTTVFDVQSDSLSSYSY